MEKTETRLEKYLDELVDDTIRSLKLDHFYLFESRMKKIEKLCKLIEIIKKAASGKAAKHLEKLHEKTIL